jgi:hypothetical protein
LDRHQSKLGSGSVTKRRDWTGQYWAKNLKPCPMFGQFG